MSRSFPFAPGVMPAAVTPFDEAGRVDLPSLARLLFHFEQGGCKGVVLAGTNGEGPSLSAFEKRDLVRTAVSLSGGLAVVLGVATPSLTEAEWLCRQAGQAGAQGILLMPPGYFRPPSPTGLLAWFRAVLDASPIPVIVYNFPRMAGVKLTPDLVSSLADHPMLAGVKDSSGEAENLAAYRAVLAEHHTLWVGDEKLLPAALQAGWSGTISGASNVLAEWIVQAMAGLREGNSAKWDLLAPALAALRAAPQPATNKAVLHALGLIAHKSPRLPLEPVCTIEVEQVLTERLGFRFPVASGA